jgi:uncharacterized protein DUF2586
MANPGQSITIRDPGLPLVDVGVQTPHIVGVSSLGTANQTILLNSIPQAVTLIGQGPGVEDVCRVLAEPGAGPVLFTRINGSVVGTNSAVTQVGTGPAMTVAGAPFDTYDGKVEVRLGGALGVGKFRYALDAHGLGPPGNPILPTWSEDITIPSGGSFVIPNTNLTLTFPSGTYVLGTTYSWTSTEPFYSSTDLSNAMTAILADTSRQWRSLHLVGRTPDSSTGSTLFAALGTHMATAEGKFRYARAQFDLGSKDTAANVRTAAASLNDKRVLGCYGDIVRVTAKPFVGWGTPRRSCIGEFTARAAASLPSTHLGRVASGPLSGVLFIVHDEDQVTTTLDDVRVSTLRTHPNRGGFFINRARLMSPVGSDFKHWHNGMCMDIACRTVVAVQQDFLNRAWRVTSKGTIDPKDAQDLEEAAKARLRANLLQPFNAEGKRGHVSAINYTVDLEANLVTTENINTTVAIARLGYSEFFTTQIGFALDVGA